MSGGLRDALIDNLNNILSPQAEVRRAAEDQIHVLEVTEGEEEGGEGWKRWRKVRHGGLRAGNPRQKWRNWTCGGREGGVNGEISGGL